MSLLARTPKLVRVRYLTSMAGDRWQRIKGEVVDMDAREAKDLVRHGVVELAPDAELGRPTLRRCRWCGAPAGDRLPTCGACLRPA